MTGATAPRLMAALRTGASARVAIAFDDQRHADHADGLGAAQTELDEDAVWLALMAGKEMRVSISSGARSTWRKPVQKSRKDIVRSPRAALRTLTVASSAISGTMESLAGLAVMMLPATVARLRICGAPTSQQARASGKACSTISGLATHWLCVTSGPR